MAFCQARGEIPYFETSAKEAINVQEAFETVAKLALENMDSDDIAADFTDPIHLDMESQKTSCYC